MKKYWANIRSVKGSVNALLIVAIILIVFIDFIADSWRPFLPKAHEIGQIITEFSIAYIVSYIFYFLVVHLKEIEDKRNIYEFCAPKTLRIFYNAKSITALLSDKTGIKIKGEYPTKDELDEILRKINPNDNYQLTNQVGYPKINFIVYLNIRRKDTLRAIDQILSKITFLESEHVKLLTRVANCDLFGSLEIYALAEKFSDDLPSLLSSSIYNYFQDVINLKAYYDIHLDKYNIKYRIKGQTG